jgi:hypothetical protein
LGRLSFAISEERGWETETNRSIDGSIPPADYPIWSEWQAAARTKDLIRRHRFPLFFAKKLGAANSRSPCISPHPLLILAVSIAYVDHGGTFRYFDCIATMGMVYPECRFYGRVCIPQKP